MIAQDKTSSSGAEAEKLAAIHLQQHGLILVSTNYRCRFGEIDLIMREGKTIVFVEVRLRKNTDFGGAAYSITPAKQKKLILTATHYLQQHGDSACRFDAILMKNFDLHDIEWIRNAFDA
ncbi:MAG: YraN family protein [Methylophilaceae bacterium]|uniref:YraN family protein n=1 Tax=Methylovorus sp. MM2 TaxID=1848038 RepID=UPI000AB89B09|nr:YraN family protein [Methylovorus sp. MM2]